MSASADWPNQAVYMHSFLTALSEAGKAGCGSTDFAIDSLNWLNGPQTDETLAPSWMWTFMVFQVQYYGEH